MFNSEIDELEKIESHFLIIRDLCEKNNYNKSVVECLFYDIMKSYKQKPTKEFENV